MRSYLLVDRMKCSRLMCTVLGVLVMASVALAQTPKSKPKLPSGIQVGVVAHHVTGTLEKGDCTLTLSGAVLRVAEYWYLPGGPAKKDLERATDPITFNGTPLDQGKVLGSVTLTGPSDFDVTWSESATATRKPWALNARSTRTGETLTAYRLLRLELLPGTNYFGELRPVPLIQFYGTETTKNVGTIKADCIPIGG